MEEQEPTVELLDRAIRGMGAGPPERAVADLTAIANRAVIELHKIARQEANRRRGEPDWAKWAGVANAARSGVLQIAAVRDSLKRLGGAPGSQRASDAPAGPEDPAG